MTKEDKQLLFKDLCARLPYEVFVEIEDEPKIPVIFEWKHLNFLLNWEWLIKPYLRPMSSMTREERAYYAYYRSRIKDGILGSMGEYNDWLNSHYFDYRDLIGKGLAIEVTKDNNPYKE